MSQSKEPQDPQPSTDRLDEATRVFAEKHDEPNFALLYMAAVCIWSEVARKMKAPEHDLGEIVGTVGAAMWNQRENFRGATFKAFVNLGTGITRRSVRASWKAKQHWKQYRRVSPDLCPIVAGVHTGDDLAGPEGIVAARETMRVLSRMERGVVEARTEGYTFAEIAEATGLSAPRVWAIYDEALRKMEEVE